ncbi:MAG: HEAT repeat domain-containing protein [Nocardioides sp.]
MSSLPRPTGADLPVADRIAQLDALVGRGRFVEVCVDLLGGADRATYLPELRYLTGHDGSDERVLDRTAWKDYWVRTWGARGLLHCWGDAATGAVVAGLGDEHYRPAEMCLKVSARHDVAGAGPGAAALTTHELPRVRAAAARALAVVGDTEHVAAVEALLDNEDAAVRSAAARAHAAMLRRLDR